MSNVSEEILFVAGGNGGLSTSQKPKKWQIPTFVWAIELTDCITPTQMSVQENDVSNESVMFQQRSCLWQEALVDFQPVKNLDSQSTGMMAFNMIGCIFIEAAISQTISIYETVHEVEFTCISRGLMLGLLFKFEDFKVKAPDLDEPKLLISRQLCLKDKYGSPKLGVRGLYDAICAKFTHPKKIIATAKKNKRPLNTLLNWLDTPFIGIPRKKSSEENPAHFQSLNLRKMLPWRTLLQTSLI
jgi:hypothetical protein